MLTVVLLDNPGVDKWQPEDDGEEGDHSSRANNGSGQSSLGEFLETQGRRALVDDRHGADGADSEENDGCSEESPPGWVFADENTELDERVDDDTEPASDTGGDTEASEDGSNTLAAVPAPRGRLPSTSSDTNTNDGGDDGVGSGNGPGVTSGNREPGWVER